MPKIVILDEETANQIAAGEVVERPVSVVKELVENSLDAGATSVEVDIYEGGLKRIAVIDNGTGMSGEDALLAFNRHATSKIKKAEDIYRIATLGFRGEALPSIAAVSRVTLKTRTKDCVSGTRLELSGGKPVSVGQVGCPAGTSVVIDELFYNTPARLKHMKAASVETGRISDLISRLAMAKPEVSFRLRHNDKVVFSAPGSGSLLDAVAAVYGIKNVREMLYIEAQNPTVALSGYISKPTLNRANRKQQTIFINNRLVKSNLLLRVIEEAYHTLLPGGRFPLVVLSLSINPKKVDINVHPAKLEVRIEQENEFAEFIKNTIKKELQSHSLVPELKLTPPKKQLPDTKAKVWQQKLTFTDESGPVSTFRDNTFSTLQSNAAFPGDREFFEKEQLQPEEVEINKAAGDSNKNLVPEPAAALYETAPVYTKNTAFPALRPMAQLMPTYILASGSEGLFIIDQHAAHERVLFEQFQRKLNHGQFSSQMLLKPVTLELGFRESQLLIKHIFFLKKIGFIVEEFGQDTFILRGVPGNIPAGREKELFLDALDFVQDSVSGEGVFNTRLAAAMACKAAVKAGQKLTLDGMQALIMQLAASESPYTCPHGRPTLIHLSYDELMLKFKRT